MSSFLTYEGLGQGGFSGPPQHGHPVSSSDRGGGLAVRARPFSCRLGTEQDSWCLWPKKEGGWVFSSSQRGKRTLWKRALYSRWVTSTFTLAFKVSRICFCIIPIKLHCVYFKARTSKEVRGKEVPGRLRAINTKILLEGWTGEGRLPYRKENGSEFSL